MVRQERPRSNGSWRCRPEAEFQNIVSAAPRHSLRLPRQPGAFTSFLSRIHATLIATPIATPILRRDILRAREPLLRICSYCLHIARIRIFARIHNPPLSASWTKRTTKFAMSHARLGRCSETTPSNWVFRPVISCRSYQRRTTPILEGRP
jgi:hypothetical protein